VPEPDAFATNTSIRTIIYWMPTEPAVQEKRPVPKRIRLLKQAFEAVGSWVLIGSMVSWGEPTWM